MNEQFNPQNPMNQSPINYQTSANMSSLEAMLEEAKKPAGNAWEVGKRRYKIVGWSWHISDNEKMLYGVGPMSGMPKVEFKCQDAPFENKSLNEYFPLSGISQRTGAPYNNEPDFLRFLMQHGITAQTILSYRVIDPMTNVMDRAKSYGPLLKMLCEYGSDEYEIEHKKKKNSDEIDTYIRKVPVVLDESGNWIPKKMKPIAAPAQTPAAPAPAAQPAVAPVAQTAPVAPVVPVVPVAPVAPVAPASPAGIPGVSGVEAQTAPVAAPAVPVAPVAPAVPTIPVAAPAGVPAAPAVPQIPGVPGIPMGIPGVTA